MKHLSMSRTWDSVPDATTSSRATLLGAFGTFLKGRGRIVCVQGHDLEMQMPE